MNTPEKEVYKLLKLEEGWRSSIYNDVTYNLTIGFGHQIKGRQLTRIEVERLFGEDQKYPISYDEMIEYWRKNPISEEDGIYLLERDIHIAYLDAKHFYGDLWDPFPDNIKVSILDLCFNLGYKYRKFKKHIAAIKKGDWEEAAKQIENSLAAAQCPNRYKKIAQRIRGDWWDTAVFT